MDKKVYHKKELMAIHFYFRTEKYMKIQRIQNVGRVYMSDEQLVGLKQNLGVIVKDKNNQSLLFSHHVLPDTVSGSDIAVFQDYFTRG